MIYQMTALGDTWGILLILFWLISLITIYAILTGYLIKEYHEKK